MSLMTRPRGNREMGERRLSMRSRLLALGVACSGLLLVAGCDRAGGAGPSGTGSPAAAAPAAAEPSDAMGGTNVVAVPPDSPQFKQLRVEAVRRRDMVTDEVVAPGRIAVNPNRVSRVLPPVQGRVLEVMAKLGDFVEQGQPLLSLDSPDADAAVSASLQAEAAERQARSALSKAETDYQRTKDLYEHKAAAEKDFLGAQNDVAQAKGNVETTRAASEQARRKLELLGLKPGEFRQPTLVRAPISGKVLEVNVTIGEYRGAVASHSDTTTAPLMTIADLSTVWMSSDVPEPAIRFVRVGEGVEISLVAFPGEVFRGRVARIADSLDPQTRTLKVHVELPNPKERFRPEMFGSIRHAGAARSVPAVPLAAIVQEYGRSVVFVERGPGRFERRMITTGPHSGDVVAVLSGLQADERVVVDGAILLKGQ
jgi:membrane fusion protein, heavy metal efflux system